MQIQFRLGQCRDGQLHVGLGQPQDGLVAQQLSLRHRHVRAGFLPLLAGDCSAILEGATPALFALPLPEQCAAGDNRRFGLTQGRFRHLHRAPGVLHRQDIARRVDFQEQLPLLHVLIVLDSEADDATRDVRR
ncbi:hypothetical protein D3C84_778840 [compost metagenome]